MFQISRQTLQDVVNSLKNYTDTSLVYFTSCLNVVTDIENGLIKFYASDLKSNVVYQCPVNIESDKDYSYSIPMVSVTSILEVIKTGSFIFETPIEVDIPKSGYYQNKTVKYKIPIYFDRYRTKYRLVASEISSDIQVPNWKVVDKDRYFKLPSEVFITYGKILTSVITKNNSIQSLNGISFKCKGDCIELAATDGKRLTIYKEKIYSFIDKEFSFVVPSDFIDKILTTIKNNVNKCSEIEVYYQGDFVLFKFDKLIFKVKTFTGIYPDYDRVIPTEINCVTYGFDKSELINCLSQVFSLVKNTKLTKTIENKVMVTQKDDKGKPLKDENKKTIKVEEIRTKIISWNATIVTLFFKDNALDISFSNPDTGNFNVSLNTKNDVSFDGLRLNFNIYYLLDMIKQIPSDTINVSINRNNYTVPIKITSTIPNLTNVLLPENR